MTTTPDTTHSSIRGRRRLFLGATLALVALAPLAACEDDGGTSHPAHEDLDAGWTCNVEDGLVRASGTITNHSSKSSFYVLETEFRLDGHVVDRRSASVDDLEPGHTARVETASSDVVDDDVTCHVEIVERFKA